MDQNIINEAQGTYINPTLKRQNKNIFEPWLVQNVDLAEQNAPHPAMDTGAPEYP